MKNVAVVTCVALLSLSASAAVASPILVTTDVIANAARTNFMDFEPLPLSATHQPTFAQDGLAIQQVNGQGDDIWTFCGNGCFFTPTGDSWYPNGGDNGWTEISLATGSDFDALGMNVGARQVNTRYLQYELLNDGASVLAGQLIYQTGSDWYLGFTGGGFDLLRVRSTNIPPTGTFGNGQFNALSIDNVEAISASAIPAPEPASLLLLGSGLAGVVATVRRRKRRVE